MSAEVGEDVPCEPGREARVRRVSLPSLLRLAPADTRHCEFIVVNVIVQPQCAVVWQIPRHALSKLVNN